MSPCIFWTGTKTPTGYGMLWKKDTQPRGHRVYAHREAYEQANGAIPAGLSVLHRCDTPSCVNPEHLFLGTQRDNMFDAVRKGRVSIIFARGENNPRAKLSDDDAAANRIALRPGELHREIAARFSISRSLVSLIGSRNIR